MDHVPDRYVFSLLFSYIAVLALFFWAVEGFAFRCVKYNADMILRPGRLNVHVDKDGTCEESDPRIDAFSQCMQGSCSQKH